MSTPTETDKKDNPENFHIVAEEFIFTHSYAIIDPLKAIDVLTSARSTISSITAEYALIVNISNQELTWYTYNDYATIKITTKFSSYMGAYCTVQVHCTGLGPMHIYKDNQDPAFTVNRGSVYVFDGHNLHLFIEKHARPCQE